MRENPAAQQRKSATDDVTFTVDPARNIAIVDLSLSEPAESHLLTNKGKLGRLVGTSRLERQKRRLVQRGP
jgi:hypothetical protein